MSEISMIAFTENAQEELHRLGDELKLQNLFLALKNHTQIPDNLVEDLQSMLLTLADMFSMSVPETDTDPLDTLLKASRDINLSRVLRERGLFRLYNLVTTKVDVYDEYLNKFIQISAFQTEVNPDSGLNFVSQEEFIGWFCREAHVPRSLVFMRLATIRKLVSLGVSIGDTYQIILAKPYAIRKALNTVATWDKEGVEDIDPLIAARLTEKMLPSKVEEVKGYTDTMMSLTSTKDEKEQARLSMIETVKPAIISLTREVASHLDVRDAMNFVTHDIANKPEMTYRWNDISDVLEIEYIQKSIDPKGREYIVDVLTIPFIPDIPILPIEIKRDLIERLPIKNRDRLDIN